MKNELLKRGFEGVVYRCIGVFGVAILSFLANWLLIRGISASDYGIFNILKAGTLYIHIFIHFGLPSILERFIPEYIQQKKYRLAINSVIIVLIIRFISGLVVVWVINRFSNEISQILKIPELSKYIPLFSIIIVVVMACKVLELTLNALLLQKAVNTALVLYNLFTFLTYYWILRYSRDLYFIILATLFCSLFLFAYFFISLVKDFLKKLPYSNENGIENASLSQVIKYGILRYFDISGEGLLDTESDKYIISYFSGSRPVGFYSFATSLARTIRLLTPIKMLVPVVTPIFISVYTSDKNQTKLYSMFQLLTKINLFFMTPAFVATTLLSDKIIRYVFHPDYLATVFTLILCAAFYLIVGALTEPIRIMWKVLKKPEIGIYGTLFVIYNIVMDFILVPKYGIAGAAIATGSSQFFSCLLQYGLLRRNCSLALPWKSISRICLNGLVMAFFLLLVRRCISNIYSLLMLMSFSVLIFAGVSYKNRVFSSQERELINKTIGKSLFVF